MGSQDSKAEDDELSLKINLRFGQPSVVDSDVLKCKEEENPTSNPQNFQLGSSKDSICRALHKLQKTNSSSWEVPHELSID